jgi:XTP/dITP diphosphohydrolase
MSRPVVVAASPRLPGLLTAAGWDALRAAGEVRCPGAGTAWGRALSDAGVALATPTEGERPEAGQTWLDLDGSVPREGAEVVAGAPEPPGARVLDLVAVMDRLRSPGGCPWDAEQTHASLLRYLLEEAYEVVEAVEEGSREDLREELGDLLLQVVFHARLAEELGDEGFGVDEVADGITAKLVRRHPHVFAAGHAASAAHVEETWERAKAVEKNRTSALDGVPVALPALARAEKLLDRLHRHGVEASLPEGDGVGERLLRDVAAARGAGISAEEALRRTVRDWERAVRARERTVDTSVTRRAGSRGME